jgi:hypothetical protein
LNQEDFEHVFMLRSFEATSPNLQESEGKRDSRNSALTEISFCGSHTTVSKFLTFLQEDHSVGFSFNIKAPDFLFHMKKSLFCIKSYVYFLHCMNKFSLSSSDSFDFDQKVETILKESLTSYFLKFNEFFSQQQSAELEGNENESPLLLLTRPFRSFLQTVPVCDKIRKLIAASFPQDLITCLVARMQKGE